MRLVILSLVLFIGLAANAKDVVLIGDSLSCGPFGKHLVENLSRRGDAVTLYCAVSSTPTNWLKGKSPAGQQCKIMTSKSPKLQLCGGDGATPPLASLLRKHKDSKFVVALGTNSLLSKSADASYRAMASALKAHGQPCEWIGPPHLSPTQTKGFPPKRIQEEEDNLDSFYDSLTGSVASSCTFHDSRHATAPGTPGNETYDGVHRTDSAGAYWVDHMRDLEDAFGSDSGFASKGSNPAVR